MLDGPAFSGFSSVLRFDKRRMTFTIADLIIFSQTMTQTPGDPRNSDSRPIASFGKTVPGDEGML
jgi:hypothetical protein